MDVKKLHPSYHKKQFDKVDWLLHVVELKFPGSRLKTMVVAALQSIKTATRCQIDSMQDFQRAFENALVSKTFEESSKLSDFLTHSCLDIVTYMLLSHEANYANVTEEYHELEDMLYYPVNLDRLASLESYE